LRGRLLGENNFSFKALAILLQVRYVKAETDIAHWFLVRCPRLDREVYISEFRFGVNATPVIVDSQRYTQCLVKTDECVHILCANENGVNGFEHMFHSSNGILGEISSNGFSHFIMEYLAEV